MFPGFEAGIRSFKSLSLTLLKQKGGNPFMQQKHYFYFSKGLNLKLLGSLVL